MAMADGGMNLYHDGRDLLIWLVDITDTRMVGGPRITELPLLMKIHNEYFIIFLLYLFLDSLYSR